MMTSDPRGLTDEHSPASEAAELELNPAGVKLVLFPSAPLTQLQQYLTIEVLSSFVDGKARPFSS